MVIGEPLIGRLLALPEVIAGAWIGGTIDTTPAVAAAGSFYGSDALKIAVIVKMSQNVFIGVTAFLLATYYAFRVERQSEERPSPLEIWFRFPKFILGFIAVSIVASLGLITKPQLAVIGTLQNWFFTFAFVCIGLDVALSDYRKIGGRPAVAFLGAQLFNIVVTLVIAWILFGLFSP
jgi:uncharacterized membrane protein YadS